MRDPDTFLYNTGPIPSLDSPNWNRRQFYSVTLIKSDRGPKVLGSGLACPPCNIGPLSTPNYKDLAAAAVHSLPGGVKVFAGQRAEGFYVDLGAIFDLGNLRPFQQLHDQSDARVQQAGQGRQRHEPAERALDRDPGADLRSRPVRPPPRHRRVDDRQPPARVHA